MIQERTRQKKKVKISTFVKVGTLTSLENQKRLMRTRKTNIPASSIRLNEERQVLNNLMKEHQLPMPQHQRLGAHLQCNSATPTTQSVEQEVQLDANTPIVDEQGSYTKKKEKEKMSATNIENRKKLKDPHTTGKKSFAIVRNDLEKEKETSDPLSLKDIFVVTRQRKPGRTYKESNEDTTRKIAEMESIETQQSENGDESINIFASIMGPEYPGRLRLYGRGVTKKSLKGKVGHFEPSSNTINDHMQKMEERIIRLEEKIEEQKEQYEEQKTMMRQEIVKDIKEKVQCSGLPIDANILATLYSRPLGEASSTQAATIHLIHRPSLGSNNQGEENEQMGDESSEDLT